MFLYLCAFSLKRVHNILSELMKRSRSILPPEPKTGFPVAARGVIRSMPTDRQFMHIYNPYLLTRFFTWMTLKWYLVTHLYIVERWI